MQKPDTQMDPVILSWPNDDLPDAIEEGEISDVPGRSKYRNKTIRLAVMLTLVIAATICGYVLHRQSQTTAGETTQAALPSTEGTSTNSASTIVVDVHGDVRHPGVYTLPADARVKDAVNAAGGYNHPEDANGVNAAAILDDGGEVVIPDLSKAGDAAPAIPAAQPTSPGSAATTTSQATSPVDINTASAETLQTLPGIGPSKANAIVQYREQHGPFQNVQQLLNVPGIGQSTLTRLTPYVQVSSP